MSRYHIQPRYAHALRQRKRAEDEAQKAREVQRTHWLNELSHNLHKTTGTSQTFVDPLPLLVLGFFQAKYSWRTPARMFT